MSDDQFERFQKCAVEVLSVEVEKVTREANFADDLDADSLDLVELIRKSKEPAEDAADSPYRQGNLFG